MLRFLLSAAAALILAVIGANILDPYMAPVRHVAPFAIAAAGLAGLGLTLLRGNGRGLVPRLVLAVLWCAVPGSVLTASAVFHLRQEAVLSASGPEVHAVGRHFIVGYTDIKEVETLAAKGLIGGVYVTHRNVRGGRAEAAENLRRDIARLQHVRWANGLPPLIIATDQEGGSISHLSPPLAPLPPLADLASASPERRAAAARDYGAIHGRQLASLGVTVNFAPVLDLRHDHGFTLLDRNSRIMERAISSDPQIAGEIGLAYAQGLHAAGVTPTLKHFPGLGRIAADTHHFTASLDTPLMELEASDWVPFRRVLSGADAMLMLGHVRLTAADPDRQASLSAKVVNIIRRDWGYQGVLITDDLVMMPVYRYGLCNAVEEGLNAGVDLMLVSFDGRQFYRAMACALEAKRAGRLDAAKLAVSDARLRAMGEEKSREVRQAHTLRKKADLPIPPMKF